MNTASSSRSVVFGENVVCKLCCRRHLVACGYKKVSSSPQRFYGVLHSRVRTYNVYTTRVEGTNGVRLSREHRLDNRGIWHARPRLQKPDQNG